MDFPELLFPINTLWPLKRISAFGIPLKVEIFSFQISFKNVLVEGLGVKSLATIFPFRNIFYNTYDRPFPHLFQ